MRISEPIVSLLRFVRPIGQIRTPNGLNSHRPLPLNDRYLGPVHTSNRHGIGYHHSIRQACRKGAPRGILTISYQRRLTR